jgi:hypothetical protein
MLLLGEIAQVNGLELQVGECPRSISAKGTVWHWVMGYGDNQLGVALPPMNQTFSAEHPCKSEAYKEDMLLNVKTEESWLVDMVRSNVQIIARPACACQPS